MLNFFVAGTQKATATIKNRLTAAENKQDKGAGFVEYAGVLLVIGAIAAAVYGVVAGDSGIGETISDGIESAVERAFGEVSEAEGGDDGGLLF
ncbi:hypothetical protein [Nocardiopsis suaedae]|uniref:DUF4244 domain-containing protein n=1 Tax=Nocardiopsis suaedae TaxID=3018444 RepID=A0ABT4TRH3_9ACTN|nr:hypothetical protein [Nocardiopsis suaedae]MDA2807272.1 hypothetical protein [Nocardiopsis suaedae]